MRDRTNKHVLQVGRVARAAALLCLGVGGFWLSAASRAAEPASPPAKKSVEAKPVSPTDTEFFETKVRAVLQQNCFNCHGGKPKLSGGLRLTTREGLLKGGDAGPVIDFGMPTDSLLLQMISYKDQDHQMPPKGKLADADIATLTEWVTRGVPWPIKPGDAAASAEPPASAPSGPTPEEKAAKMKAHWAYQPVTRPAVPTADDPAWANNPIDAFIAAKLKEKGLKPAPPAPRRALIRRATYDLTGLPPTLEEVNIFEKDESPDAFVKLIERLLESPRYGERWGRHWLDVARYAETNGYERDGVKPYIWRYRDYVIDAFNKDKPYDQFVKEQIAGDELPGAGREQIIATGFLRLALWDDEPADKAQGKYDTLDDVVSATAQGFLGMTMGCARCHAHKIDYYPHADYYRFLAFFQNLTDMHTTDIVRGILEPEDQLAYDGLAAVKKKEIDAVKGEIEAIEKEFERRLKIAAEIAGAPELKSGDSKAQIKDQGERLLGEAEFKKYNRLKMVLAGKNAKKLPRGLWATAAMENGPDAPQTFIFTRGNPNVPAEKVEPGFPSMLPGGTPEIPKPPAGMKSSGRRRVLAEWIADPKNPLTARVMVNRIWQHHFGRGIVRTPNDFGLGGSPPTHPELLDYLASEFTARGWSVKAMHRMIMNSKAYQMSVAGDQASMEKDPSNDWFARFNMRRLEAEEIRDSILNVAGGLTLKMGGPSVYPRLPKEVLATASMPDKAWGNSSEEDQNRRSVYVYLKRSLVMPILSDFDLADTDSSCPARFTSILPTQALNMLNSEFILEEAGQMANRLRSEAPGDPVAQAQLAIEAVTQRPAKPEEVKAAADFLAEMEREEKLDADKAVERFCLLALNLNEFMFVE